MKIKNIIVPTRVARTGMTVGDAFRECIRCQVPAIPFVNNAGIVTGRMSIRETIRQVCIPDYVISHADLLGDNLGCLTIPEEHARQVITLPVDRFVMPEFPQIDSNSPILKAVAVMEKHQLNFVFVIDDGNYMGVVTIESIASRMLQMEPV